MFVQAHGHCDTAGNGSKPLHSATAVRIWPIEVAVCLTPRQVEWNAHYDVSRLTHITNVKSWAMWSALLQTVNHLGTKEFMMKLILWLCKCSRRRKKQHQTLVLSSWSKIAILLLKDKQLLFIKYSSGRCCQWKQCNLHLNINLYLLRWAQYDTAHSALKQCADEILILKHSEFEPVLCEDSRDFRTTKQPSEYNYNGLGLGSGTGFSEINSEINLDKFSKFPNPKVVNCFYSFVEERLGGPQLCS